jgi:hypothetical protein
VNSSSKAAWELKMTFLNPSGNLCMIPKRLYIGQFFTSLFPSRPFCGSAHTFQYFSVTHDQRWAPAIFSLVRFRWSAIFKNLLVR